jgi:predicted nucleic acid-binding protein
MSESNLLGRPQDLRSFGVVEVNQELIFKAVGRHFKSRISYYDALMVEAALYGGAGVPYSEDLQHGPDLEISKSSTLLCNPEAGACNAGDSAHDLD